MGLGALSQAGCGPSLWLLWPCLPWTLGHEPAPVVSQWKLTGLPPPPPAWVPLLQPALRASPSVGSTLYGRPQKSAWQHQPSVRYSSGAARARRVTSGGLLGAERLLSEAGGFCGAGLAGKDSRFLPPPGHLPWSLGAVLARVGRSTGSVIKHLNLVPLIFWGVLHLLGGFVGRGSVHWWSRRRARDGAAQVTLVAPRPARRALPSLCLTSQDRRPAPNPHHHRTVSFIFPQMTYAAQGPQVSPSG